MANTVEGKLDDDFLFYCNFVGTFLKRISDQDVFRHARNWILKLCCEPCEGVDRKRSRNIYLANLLICVQNGKLEEPFLQPPFHVDIADALQVFCNVPSTFEEASWLNDTQFEIRHKATPSDKPGRTYFATKTLPDGQGAFAYVGISLTDDDWLLPSSGDQSAQRLQLVEQQLQRRHLYEAPEYEMEKILAKRKDPRERERVLTFYDTLLLLIADELSGKAPEFNETIEGLLEQLCDDLKAKGQWQCCYEGLEDYERRAELLLTLYDRIKTRRDKVSKREEILDDIEQKVMPHLFEVSVVEAGDEYQLPAAMWQQAMEKMPNKKQMERLKQSYPIPVLEKFIILLAAFKEAIAERMHRMHERICTQMKKELRKEGLKKRKQAEEMEKMCLDTETIYRAVWEHYKKKLALDEQNRAQSEQLVSEHTRLYEDLKAAALDAQKLVEEEAAKGKFLAEQINTLAQQGGTIKEINEASIRKCEQANAKILRSIKSLNHHIKIYETRISNIRSVGDQTRKNVSDLICESCCGK